MDALTFIELLLEVMQQCDLEKEGELYDLELIKTKHREMRDLFVERYHTGDAHFAKLWPR